MPEPTHPPGAAERAARLLLAARRTCRALENLPEDCRPRSLEEAYEVQAALERLDGRPLGGWKIGGTSELIQKQLGLDRPFPGRVFLPTIHASPARIERHRFIALALEPEFAFRLGRDLPPRPAPYAREEVAEAVASLHPACELVDTRLAVGFKAPAPCIIADNGCNAALVHGAAVADWRRFDLAQAKVRFSLNGKKVAEGSGAAVLGHPSGGAGLARQRLERPRHRAQGGPDRHHRHLLRLPSPQGRRRGLRRLRRARHGQGDGCR